MKSRFVLRDSDTTWQNLLPLTFVRPIAACRIGILTIQEKWEKHLNSPVQLMPSRDYLSFGDTSNDHSLLIDSSVLPNEDLVAKILALAEGEAIVHQGVIIAQYGTNTTHQIPYTGSISQIKYPYDFFQKNDEELRSDYRLLTMSQVSRSISDTNRIIGHDLFVAESAKVSCAILNTEAGPIYIDEGAEVMEGAIIRGPFYLGKNSQLKMGAKVYGATTIGPGCKVGGEISNTVFFGNSNKAHDGFLGNAVISEWCNLGADTNSSNLKNNYAKIDLYNYLEKKYIKTDLTFCGLIMGDHSKAGINTMFNTSTVVGIYANVYGADFLPKHIPSFSWGSAQKLYEYRIDKALDTIEIVMARRNQKLSDRDQSILQYLFEHKSSF